MPAKLDRLMMLVALVALPARAQVPSTARDTASVAEVVVTASRSEQAAATVPTSVAVVGAEAIAARGLVRLDDVLRNVPGVQLSDNQVSVRGSSGFSYNVGSRVLFLVDGVPLLGPDAEGIPFDALPLEQAARIEVVKGPGSALYGSGALGGVINLITRDFPERPATAVTALGGAYEPVRHAAWRAGWAGADAFRRFGYVSASHARRLGGRVGMWATVSYRDDAGYLRLGAGSRATAYAKLGWRASGRVRVDLLGGVSRGKGDTFLYWNGLGDPLNPGTLALGGRTTGSSDNLTYRYSVLPTATVTVSPRTVATLRARVFGVTIRALDDRGRPFPLADGTAGVRYGGEVQVTHAAAFGLVTAGATLDANATRTSFYADDRYRGQPEAAAFAQWEAEPLEGLRVTPGVRFDAYRLNDARTERRVSPKLTVGYEVSPRLHLRAGYGAGFRVPGVSERFTDDTSFFPLLSNPALRPETSEGAEAGVRGERRFGRTDVRVDAAAFWTGYRRLVEPTFVSEGGRSGFRFVNLTRARIRGVEASVEAVRRVFGRAATAGASVQLLDAYDTGTGRPLVYRSQYLVQTRAEAALPFGLALGADYRFASRPGRVDSDFALFVPSADAFTDAHVLDARLAWTPGPALSVTFLVRNALDRYYAERPAILAPPRAFALQVRAAF